MKKLRLLSLVVALVGVIAIFFLQPTDKERIKYTIFTYKEVNQVYEHIILNSGQSQRPPFHIVENMGVINAWTDGASITITTGMLHLFHNKHELAMVLGHEVAHFIAHDIYHGDLLQEDIEANADKLGAFIMMRAGYDPCKGKEIMHTFKCLFGDFAAPVDHPSNAYRYDQLDLPMCHTIFD